MRNRASEGKLQSGPRKEVPGTKSDLMSQLIRPLIPFPALAGRSRLPLISVGDGDAADGEEGTWKWAASRMT